MSLPPIHRQVVVPVAPEEAFDRFTERIGSWWPAERHSVRGTGSVPAFRDGSLIETAADGTEFVWGEVLDWQPPRSFRMTWHPGRDAGGSSVVEVSFAPVAESATLVTITHSGWETLDARNEYRSGWPRVLSDFSSFSDLPGGFTDDSAVVLVLSHAPAAGDPFAHPLFREHAAFLTRLREQGILVGAGPFPASGEGMTIVRVGSAAAAAEVVRAAHYEDGSVTGGVLEVKVRPWVVRMHGSSLA